MNRLTLTILFVFICGLGLYVASYFLCVRDTVLFVSVGGNSPIYPEYRFVPFSRQFAQTFYSPLYRLDQAYLRPAKWEPRRTTSL